MDSLITWFLVGILYGFLRKQIHAVLHYIFQGRTNAFAPNHGSFTKSFKNMVTFYA